MPAAVFALDALRRHPDVEAPNLHAVDASDRLILDEAAPALAETAPGTVVVINDHYGALTLGAIALHGARDVRAVQDSIVAEQALTANARAAGIAEFASHDALTADALAGAELVLLQLPRSLAELDDVARAVAAFAAPTVTVIAGGRIKHMTPAMNEVFARYFDRVDVSLARQKSRVLTVTGAKPGVEAPTPRREHHADVDLTVCATGAAFAGTSIDIGTRVVLGALDGIPPRDGVAVDLGCGTGVIATVLARMRPGLSVIASDQSAGAAASARLTADANGVGDRIEVRREDAGEGIADASVDLVVLNPPFHLGSTVHTGAASKLFAAAARILKPGGTLVTVYNSHLAYRAELERTVGRTTELARTPKFTVTASIRQ